MERESHPVFDALHIPPTALDQGGVEVLRAAIVEGGLHVSLRRAFDDPEAWGMLLADVTRHIARIYAGEGKFREEETIERIRALLRCRDGCADRSGLHRADQPIEGTERHQEKWEPVFRKSREDSCRDQRDD